MIEEAIRKLEKEKNAGQYDRCAAIMKDAVGQAVADFCRQDEEFAQAVVQGGTFENCMKAVAKGCGKGISDLEAFRRAAQFYFPGAEVRFQMTVDLCGSVREPEETAAPEPQQVHKAVSLDLSNFL